jgi:hypothetical protein
MEKANWAWYNTRTSFSFHLTFAMASGRSGSPRPPCYPLNSGKPNTMRKHIYVRPARPEDRELFVKWTWENLHRNGADPEVISYPTTFVLCAYDENGPLVFMPVQQPLVLDAIAIRPEADSRKVASALRDLFKACVMQGHLKGSGEIYFISDEQTIQQFASHQVFEKLPVSLYRVKLSDLEKES